MKISTYLLIVIALAGSLFSTNCKSENNKDVKKLSFTNNSIQSRFQASPDESIDFEKAKQHYEKFPDRWEEAFKFLAESDLSKLDIGEYELSEDVRAIVSEYETKDLEEAKFESHKKYIDLQYVISGKELIGHTNKEDLNVIAPYSDVKDIMFYDYEGDYFLSATPNNYFIFFPEDRHRPCIDDGEKTNVRKVVLKIRSN